MYFPISPLSSLGKRLFNGFFISPTSLTNQALLPESLFRYDNPCGSAHPKTDYAVCHLLDRVVMSNHNDRIAVFLIDIL